MTSPAVRSATRKIGADIEEYYYNRVGYWAQKWGVTRAAVVRAAVQSFIDVEDDPDSWETGSHDLAHDCDWRQNDAAAR